MTINPTDSSLRPSEQQNFTVTVDGANDSSVTWTADAGTINGTSNSIVYVAPATAGTYILTATSNADSNATVTATIEVDNIQVSISPASVTLGNGQTSTFTATVTGSGDTSVTWSASGGTLTPLGTTASFTAPNDDGVYTITAVSNANNQRSANATVTVE